MKKIMTFFSGNVGSLVLTFTMVIVLFSLKDQFGINDTLATTIIIAVMAFAFSEVIRRLCLKTLHARELTGAQAMLDEVEKSKKK